MNPDPDNGNSPIEILVVEDSRTQLLLLQMILEKHGFKVTCARDGKAALECLETCRPALVITDIQMPGMDGYELCHAIKSDARFKDLPVILLTALSAPQDIIHGLECGADNFVVKPYDEAFLLSRIVAIRENQRLRKDDTADGGISIYFDGKEYLITSGRRQILNLLLSTYETAVQKNLELTQAKQLLEEQAGELREKSCRIEADLDMARELQTAFLPQRYPAFPPGRTADESALRFCHRYSTTTELGGDFFDILRVSDTKAGIFICDVMGHGVRAALVTAIIRGLLQELAPCADDPARFLSEMNHGLCAILKQTATSLFASAFYCVLDAATGELRHANAGHPYPFLLRRLQGAMDRVAPVGVKPGAALGVFPESCYVTAAHQLGAGDLLVLFTDGLYEVEGPGGKLFTQEQLGDLLAQSRAPEPIALLDEVIRRVLEFTAEGKFEDDVCLVGVEFRGTG